MKEIKINNINSLTQNGILNNELLVLISNLTLEDLIAIKIELSATHLKNRLYGLDITLGDYRNNLQKFNLYKE